jgi:integrase
MASCCRRYRARRLKALGHDPQLLVIRPAPPATSLDHLKPFKLSTALMAVHKDCYAPIGLTQQDGTHRRETDRATVRQKKTGRPVRFELSEQTRQAVDEYLKVTGKRPGDFLFTGRRGPSLSMTTRQYARLVSEWIGSVGLDPRLFGTHSLRRTKATLIYRRTGNLRAVQLLLGHTKIESTVRYLGIEVDDALAIAEQVDV